MTGIGSARRARFEKEDVRAIQVRDGNAGVVDGMF